RHGWLRETGGVRTNYQNGRRIATDYSWRRVRAPATIPHMSQPPPPGPTAGAPTLATAARWVVILVGAFLLLRELGPILKPLFLPLEAGRFPARVRRALSEPRAERIMQTIVGINEGIAHYLTAKVKASLLLAVPIFIVLFVFGTPFALIWALLAFFCNFIPYL